MSTRRALRAVTATGLMAVAVAGCSSTDNADTAPSAEDLRANTVTALDFPRTVFEGWEITDPAARPASVIPAVTAAAGTDSGLTYSPADCGPDGANGAPLWAIAQDGSTWAGQVGENAANKQSFNVTVAVSSPDSLNAVTDFAQRCGHYTVTADGKTVDVTTDITNAEPLRYGLSDARLFTTTATVAGSPEQAHSTLTAVGVRDGRLVTGQFTAPGRIEGPTINVAGNWWNIVAMKTVDGKR